MDEREKKETKLEIKARKLCLRRLHSAVNGAKKQAEKQAALRKERLEKLSKYESYREAQDDFGWGFITEEEFDEAVRILEQRDRQMEEDLSAEEIALNILEKIAGHIAKDIRGLEWELLPEKEQERIRKSNEEILQRRKDRKGNEQS